MGEKQQSTDGYLRVVITAVASFALVISLLASIFEKNGEFGGVSLVFGSVAAMVFGANMVKNK